MSLQSPPPEEVTRRGEEFYFSVLKKQLEPKHNGEYVAIEVESGKYFVNADLMKVINEARAEFPNRLLHIVQIGELHKPTISQRTTKYAWQLR